MTIVKNKYKKHLLFAAVACIIASVFAFYIGAIHYYNPGIAFSETFTWEPFQKFIYTLLPNVN